MIDTIYSIISTGIPTADVWTGIADNVTQATDLVTIQDLPSGPVDFYTGCSLSLFQIDCYNPDITDARTLKENVMKLFIGRAESGNMYFIDSDLGLIPEDSGNYFRFSFTLAVKYFR